MTQARTLDRRYIEYSRQTEESVVPERTTILSVGKIGRIQLAPGKIDPAPRAALRDVGDGVVSEGKARTPCESAAPKRRLAREAHSVIGSTAAADIPTPPCPFARSPRARFEYHPTWRQRSAC